MPATLLIGAVQPSQFPSGDANEVAVIGRSNVGKSSLINALLRDSSVARVSGTPGKTREINFFVTDLGFVLVDLPGYGYAKVSKSQRQGFASLIRQYLFDPRPQRKVVLVLVDSRHDPQPLDMAMIEELEFAGVSYVVVLTKCDKLAPAPLKERVDQVKGLLAQCRHFVDVVPTSAQKGDGRTAVLAVIKRVIESTNAPQER
jgi:GTP-binding protein